MTLMKNIITKYYYLPSLSKKKNLFFPGHPVYAYILPRYLIRVTQNVDVPGFMRNCACDSHKKHEKKNT